MGAIQGLAPSLRVEVTSIGLRDAGEIEQAVTVAREANGGLIVTVSPLATVIRELIITLAAQHRGTAVYPLRYFATSGGLISYGPERLEPYRRAPSYVDRILGRQGRRPAGGTRPSTSWWSISRLPRRSARSAGHAARARRRGDRMKRREFIRARRRGGVAARGARGAAGQVATIRFLGATTPTIWSPFVGAFLQRLRELGWIDGRDIAIEYRWAEGGSPLCRVRGRFVQRRVDVIVTAGATATMSVKKATSTIPIVFTSAGDPVGTGLVASLALPGRQCHRSIEHVDRSWGPQT